MLLGYWCLTSHYSFPVKTTVGSSLPPFVLFMFYYDYCVYFRMLVYNTISISDNVLVTVTWWLPSVEKELLTTPGVLCVPYGLSVLINLYYCTLYYSVLYKSDKTVWIFIGKVLDEGDSPMDLLTGLQPLTTESVLKIRFRQCGSVIAFSIPKIILLSSTK